MLRASCSHFRSDGSITMPGRGGLHRYSLLPIHNAHSFPWSQSRTKIQTMVMIARWTQQGCYPLVRNKDNTCEHMRASWTHSTH